MILKTSISEYFISIEYFLFDFLFNKIFVHNRRHCIAVRKTVVSSNFFTILLVKYYLRYKTITSQNVSFEAQFKNFLTSSKSYVPFSRYSRFCIFNHPMIYQIYDAMMSISTWDTGCLFLIYRLNHNLGNC